MNVIENSSEPLSKRVRKTNTISMKKIKNESINNPATNETEPNKQMNKPRNKKEIVKEIPTIYNIETTQNCNYSVIELKQYLKSNNQIFSGTKKVLHDRLFGFLKFSRAIVKFQSIYRGQFVRTVYKLFEKYQAMITDCVNDQDFYSFEPLRDLDKYQIICVKDPDGPVYGFDISSICQYKRKLDYGVELTNPYTRNKFPPSFFEELSKITIASKKSIVPTVVDINTQTEMDGLSFEKRVELRAVALFQYINSLGNYSDVSWFMSLSKRRLLVLIQELFDIWNFRLNISRETKLSVCPPNGKPFEDFVPVNIVNMSEFETKNYVLNIFENFVYRGVNRDSQCLGAFYILGALTMVSSSAANASPWLYQSFIY